MPNTALKDTKTWDIAVDLRDVTKVYRQKQTGDGILQNLMHPRSGNPQ